jgi:hypothetical protein
MKERLPICAANAKIHGLYFPPRSDASASMTRIIAYIDGLNLCHAIASLRKPHLKRLDLWALSHLIARDGETIEAVKYFSAYATWLPDAHLRHREYVKALEHRGVTCIMGHFKSKPRTCKQCAASWMQHEEKETDVHIAARMVADAYEDRFNRGLLMIADGDLAPALNIVKPAFPMKEIFVAGPPGRYNHARRCSSGGNCIHRRTPRSVHRRRCDK